MGALRFRPRQTYSVGITLVAVEISLNRQLSIVYTDDNALRLIIRQGDQALTRQVNFRGLLRARTYLISADWDKQGVSPHLRARFDDETTTRSAHEQAFFTDSREYNCNRRKPMLLMKWVEQVKQAANKEQLDELLQHDHFIEVRPKVQTAIIKQVIEHEYYERAIDLIKQSDRHSLMLDKLTSLTMKRSDEGYYDFLKSDALTNSAQPPSDIDHLRSLFHQTIRRCSDPYYEAHRDLLQAVLAEDDYQTVTEPTDWSERIERCARFDKLDELKRILDRTNAQLPDDIIDRALRTQSLNVARFLFEKEGEYDYPEIAYEALIEDGSHKQRHQTIDLVAEYMHQDPPRDLLLKEAQRGWPGAVRTLLSNFYDRSDYRVALRHAFEGKEAQNDRYGDQYETIATLLSLGEQNGWLDSQAKTEALVGFFSMPRTRRVKCVTPITGSF